ncbi:MULTISPECIES: reverse transcriptase domain-containing protein [Priestia]|uniref:reverse transcriptase domain-containing protein n=1 Tax=Priestia TaxID=2800373 RepID=UPI00077D7F32|nr:reverse transcriptase domain-containing protein [Priestia megaterium]
MSDNNISYLAYKYILAMAETKKYNPQTIANQNVLKRYGFENIKNEMDRNIKDFCEIHSPNKARDFVYKSDYFTPRNMHLINPLYYTYYTCIVFNIAYLFLGTNTTLDFSNDRMKIFYSGLLDINSSEEEIKNNAIFNKRYRTFQKEREKYFGSPVLKLDIQDFFNSIKVKPLLSKLRGYLGRHPILDDLEYFLEFCGFDHIPQLHYSIASSILSQFYLREFDFKLYRILEKENLMLVRFVDDMFIIQQDSEMDVKKDNNLLNEISYLLWQDELVLNSHKTKILSPEEYKSTVQLSEYDEKTSYLSEQIINSRVEEILNNDYLLTLVQELCEVEKSKGIDLKVYKELVSVYISIEGEDTRKVINHIIFSRQWENMSNYDLLKLVDNWKYILFNPSQFTILYILICRYLEDNKLIDGTRIKRLLNYLFRNENFTFRDTLVAVSYLFQNQKKNSELLNRVENVNPEYVNFIQKFI